MDETYIKVKGEWHYLYRAVDKAGDTVDFMLLKERNQAAATVFFTKAMGSNGVPEKVTVDKSGAKLAGLNFINFQIEMLLLLGFSFMQIQVRQIKYIHNIVEQDHRGIEKMNPMIEFKSFNSAASTLVRIELCRMLKKGQHIETKNSPVFEQFYGLAA